MFRARFLSVVAVTAALLLNISNLRAVPADPKPFKVRQPDGTEISIRLRGDEWFSWEETEDGRPVGTDAKGFRVYLKKNAQGETTHSGKRVGLDKPDTDPWRPKPDAKRQREIDANHQSAALARAQSTATGLIPVLCGNFSDTTPTMSVTTISNVLFQTGPGVRSMSTYYTEVSYGKFTVASGPSGVKGWFNAPNTRAYYGATNGTQNDIRAPQFVRDIVQAAIANGYDFSPYDQDGDGKVDVVNVVHTGGGQEAGAGANAIWSHRFSLSQAGLQPVQTPSGLLVDDYVIEPELSGAGTNNVVIGCGVFVHEHGHALGLPDLYDTDYSSLGVGNWSGMSFGANLGVSKTGDCPAHFDPWCKMKLGWLSPVNYTLNSQNVSFPCAEGTAFAARLWKDGVASQQYFLVENRLRTNFDAMIPSDGLLIWHIDESKTGNTKEWYPVSAGGAPANTNSGNYVVALVQADGLFQMEITNTSKALPVSAQQNYGDSGDPFPGTTGNRLFDYNSSPNSRAYNINTTPGINSYVVVSNISDASAVMTADIYTRSPNSGPDVQWVNIAGVVPPYDGATFTTLDAGHPVVIKALPGPTGTSLSQIQLYISRSSDGRWWDFSAHNWITNPIPSLANLSGATTSGVTFAYQNDLPSGANLSNGGYTFIIRVINSASIATEIQMGMNALHLPEVNLSLTDNAYINSLTNFNALATENSGIGVARVEVALFYETDPNDAGSGDRWYWDGYNWTTTPLWLGADFDTHPAQATLGYPIGPDASHLISDQPYFIAARAVDALGNAVTNQITVFYDTGTPPTRYWRYGADGSWSDPANWNPIGVPGNGEHVAINAAGDYTVTVTGSFSAGSLRFGRNVGLSKQHLNIPAGSSLSLGSSETNKFAGSAVLDQGGDFSATGYTRFYSGATWNWSGGTLAATLGLDVNTTSYLDGNANKLLNGAVLINRGQMVWRGNGDITATGPARIENYALFELQNDRGFYDINYYDYVSPVFFNAGVFRKTVGTGTNLFDGGNQGFVFTNIAYVQVDSGALAFASSTYLGHGGYFLGSGVIKQTAGTMTAYGTNTIVSGTTLRIESATLGGSGGFAGAGTLLLTNTPAVADNITILPGGTLELAAATYSSIASGAVLRNLGTVKWTAGDILCTGSLIRNEGTFLARSVNGAVIDNNYYDYVPGEFLNLGVFRKDVATTNQFRSDNYGVRFHNCGIVDVQIGEVDFNGGGSSTNGVFSPTGAGRIQFDGMDHYLRSGSHFDVSGTLRIASGSVTQFGITNVVQSTGTLEVSGGLFDGIGFSGGPGIFVWSGGSFGGTNTLLAGGTMNITGSAAKIVARNATVVNAGTMRWTGDGDIGGSIGSVIRNVGLFDAQSDRSFYDYDYYDYGAALFENAGTFRKSASTGITIFDSGNQGFSLTNIGVVDIQAGVVSLRSATYLGHGGSFSGPSYAIQDANTVTIYGTNTVAGGGRLFVGAAMLAGTGSFGGAGSLVWTNGVNHSGNLTILQGGTLDILPSTTVTLLAGAVLTNAGTINWQNGSIGARYSWIYNTGTFLARSPLGSFYDYDYYDYTAPEFINLGTFRKDVASTNVFDGVYQGYRFHNCGTVDIQAGEMNFNGGGSSTNGTFQTSIGGRIQFNGLDHYLFGGSHFDVSGSLRILSGSVTQFGAVHNVQAGGTLEVAGGTLDGIGSSSGAGTFLWTGGTFGGTNTILSNGSLDISGNSEKQLGNNARLINNGIVRWTGTGGIGSGAAGVIENNQLFEARNDAAIYDNNNYDYTGCSFVNNGTFRKTASSGATRIAADNQGFSFANNGTLAVDSGVLAIESTATTGSGSKMNVVLSGYVARTNFGQIQYSGTAPLGGELNVTLTNSFAPTNGGTFPVVLYAGRSGQFASVNFPALSGGVEWRTDYLATSVSLRVRPSPSCSPTSSGLIGWWDGNGGTNLAGWYNLSPVHGATNSPGLNGKAFTLDGTNQYWRVADAAAFRPTNLTVEAWVNFANPVGLQALVGKPYGNSVYDSFQIWWDNGVLHGAIAASSGFQASLSYTWTPSVGTWHHVAFTYDQPTATGVLFLDGSVVASDTNAPGPIVYDTQPFLVGADIENGNEAFFFKGQIDEVALYDHALTTNEIGSLYLAEAVGRCPIPPPMAIIYPTITPVNSASNMFHGMFAAPRASQAIIEVSTNLVNWAAIQTNAPFNGTATIDELINRDRRFYRMLVVP